MDREIVRRCAAWSGRRIPVRAGCRDGRRRRGPSRCSARAEIHRASWSTPLGYEGVMCLLAVTGLWPQHGFEVIGPAPNSYCAGVIRPTPAPPGSVRMAMRPTPGTSNTGFISLAPAAVGLRDSVRRRCRPRCRTIQLLGARASNSSVADVEHAGDRLAALLGIATRCVPPRHRHGVEGPAHHGRRRTSWRPRRRASSARSSRISVCPGHCVLPVDP